MTDKPLTTTNISEHLLEIQYAPNPKILDYRGKWSEEISRLMELKEWSISENRIDIFNQEKSMKGFVSFKNAGFLIKNSQNNEYFEDKAIKFLKYFFNQAEFGSSLFVNRIGVRLRYGVPCDKSFDELMELFSSKFYSIKQDALAILNAKIIDNSVVLTLETSGGKINVNAGPMKNDQIKHVMNLEEDFSPVSLYIDIDSWSKPNRLMEMRDLFQVLKGFSTQNQDRFVGVKNLVLGN